MSMQIKVFQSAHNTVQNDGLEKLSETVNRWIKEHSNYSIVELKHNVGISNSFGDGRTHTIVIYTISVVYEDNNSISRELKNNAGNLSNTCGKGTATSVKFGLPKDSIFNLDSLE